MEHGWGNVAGPIVTGIGRNVPAIADVVQAGMDGFKRNPVVQPCSPAELMIVDAGDASIEGVVSFDEFTGVTSVVLQKVQRVGDAHGYGGGETRQRGQAQPMRLPTEVGKSPQNGSRICQQFVS